MNHASYWESEKLPASHFETFVQELFRAQQLCEPEADPQPVAGESAAPQALVSWVRNTGLRVFALRAMLRNDRGPATAESAPQDRARMCQVVDLCLLPVSEQDLILGVTLRGEDAAHAQQLPVWAEATQWGLRRRQRPWPGFSQLCALAGSTGALGWTDLALRQELALVVEERDALAVTCTELDDELRAVRTQLASMKAASDEDAARLRELLEQADSESAQRDDASPWTSYAQLPLWTAQHAHRVVVLPRALGACKKALYEEPAAVFKALAVLAGPYWEHRTGKLGLAEFEQAVQSAGFRLSGSTVPSIAGEQGEAYFVPWRGRRRFLEWHLAKGGGRDERYCLRVYFFWCEETERAVVGWLPSHLPNSLS